MSQPAGKDVVQVFEAKVEESVQVSIDTSGRDRLLELLAKNFQASDMSTFKQLFDSYSSAPQCDLFYKAICKPEDKVHKDLLTNQDVITTHHKLILNPNESELINFLLASKWSKELVREAVTRGKLFDVIFNDRADSKTLPGFVESCLEFLKKFLKADPTVMAITYTYPVPFPKGPAESESGSLATHFAIAAFRAGVAKRASFAKLAQVELYDLFVSYGWKPADWVHLRLDIERQRSKKGSAQDVVSSSQPSAAMPLSAASHSSVESSASSDSKSSPAGSDDSKIDQGQFQLLDHLHRSQQVPQQEAAPIQEPVSSPDLPPSDATRSWCVIT